MEVPKEILDAVAEIEEAELLVKYLKSNFNNIISDVLWAIENERERANAACAIFYLVPRADTVKLSYVVPRSEMSKAKVDILCIECKTSVEHILKSKSAWQKLQKGFDTFVCTACTKKKNEQSHATWEIRRREEKEREDTIINNLVTMPYTEYLKTEHWSKIRKSALRRAKYKCQLCKNDGELHVHHNTYENRGHEEYTDVIVLCRSCHAQFHGKDKPQ